ncbi:galactose mutarotase [Hoylesella buccalis]|jgi:aldose 1-epimerase|uniref:aldose epimerase family protein n=1 Tax=Hoylesella buccalis TaxID=28127 RepID=UPI001D148D7B|nr:aldose epimerase family protein [Hoylesella buccalis]UEA62969.1 galactose mutarotase [Hoylesella buccalis]UWP49743.1 galactose mutarotase [Hoylesella buccalis ATCC 35310]
MTNTTETENLCGLKSKDFQTTIDGKNTDLYILKNNVGNEVAITNYGGAIVAIMVPDKEGKLANVIQGHDNIQDVIDSPEPYLSTLIGRYGNRIAKGKFHLHGKEYNLPINNGPNCLHGGNKGFNARVWDALQMDDQTLVLKYVSPYGEEGFSGELRTTVVYSFNDDNELSIEYMSTTNKKTIINLTSHGFFSLPGIANPTPTIENQICEINADYYIPIDDTSIPTGEIRFVEGTPFDFRQPKSIGQDIEADDVQIKNGAGYDHCFVLNKKEEGELSFAARLTDPTSGRIMEVYTTEPGVQLYTDNWADGYKGQHGATFPRRSAVCFEAQHFPDSPNHPYFPSVVLKPNQEYKQKTVYKFYTQK